MGRPTLTTLALFGTVFVVQRNADAFGVGPEDFALAVPLSVRPWTIAVSVYAHASPAHLATNAIALAILGPVVAYATTSTRFHAFFVGAGATAGVVQVLATLPDGSNPVIGASGAIFALLGYAVFGNRAAEWALSWSPFGWFGAVVLFAVFAAGVTLATAAPGVALVAHFTGFLLGSVAGRANLLHKDRTVPAER